MYILKLDVKSKEELCYYFITHFKYGGMFVPSDEYFELGEEVFLVINFLWQKDKLALSGKIAWVAGERVTNYDRGVGVHFNNDKAGVDACHQIELLLGDLILSEHASASL